MAGYLWCACGTCCEVTIGEPGELCEECIEAGCEAGAECCRTDEEVLAAELEQMKDDEAEKKGTQFRES